MARNNSVYSMALELEVEARREVAGGKTPLGYAARPDLLPGAWHAVPAGGTHRQASCCWCQTAKPDTSQRHRYCGDEPALTITGRVQARYLAGRLTRPSMPSYSGPERYAEETACMVSEIVGAPMRTVPELAEIEYTPEDCDRDGQSPGSSPPIRAGTRSPASRRAGASASACCRPSRRCCAARGPAHRRGDARQRDQRLPERPAGHPAGRLLRAGAHVAPSVGRWASCTRCAA